MITVLSQTEFLLDKYIKKIAVLIIKFNILTDRFNFITFEKLNVSSVYISVCSGRFHGRLYETSIKVTPSNKDQ